MKIFENVCFKSVLAFIGFQAIASQIPHHRGLYGRDPCVTEIGVYVRVINGVPWRKTTYNSSLLRKPYDDRQSIKFTAGSTLSGALWMSIDKSFLPDGRIATQCPPLGQCGTRQPVYLAAYEPNAALGIQNVTVYVHTKDSGCGQVLGEIPVKYCEDDTFYYGITSLRLFNVPLSAPSAYCIADGPSCPAGRFVPSGSTSRGCLPLLDNVTSDVNIQPMLPDNRERQLEFACRVKTTGSGVKLENQNIQVEWHSSKFGLLRNETAVLSESFSEFVLKDWIDPERCNLGQTVYCRVRIEESWENGTMAFSRWTSSQKFFAGIEVSETNVRMSSNSSKTIYLRSTVPVRPEVSEKVLISIQKQIIQNVWQPCGQKSLLAIINSSCGVEINSANTSIPLTIHAKELHPLSGTQTTTIRLQTALSPLNWFFSNCNLPDITVTITPPPVSYTVSATCTMRADPHVMTFDRYRYDHQMAGEYVIVKDTRNDIQVNGFFQATNSIRWFSLCGIAVRSGGDVFIYNKCSSKPNGQSELVVLTRGCNAGGITYSEGVSTFEVRVPSGMLIKGNNRYRSLRHFDLTISVEESSYNSTFGLCGTFNDNQTNDLLHRDLLTISPLEPHPFSRHEEFSISWSVSEEDSLFTDITPNDAAEEHPPTFCSCADGNSETGSECGAAGAKQACENNPNLNDATDKLFKRCKAPARRRRAVDMYSRTADGSGYAREKRQASNPADTRTDYDNDEVVDPYVDPSWTFQEPEWREGWDDAKARDACSAQLRKGRATVASSVPGITREDYLEQCVYDIKISGGSDFVAPLVDTMVEDARDVLVKNTSLWSVSPTGVLQPDFSMLNQLCPDDCSNNGVCKEGSCMCSGDYFGESCSLSRQDPAVVTGVAWGGTCDVSLRPCQAVALYGNNFLYDSSTAACLVEEFEMDEQGTIAKRYASVPTTLETATRSKAYCDLPTVNRNNETSNDRLIVHGYNITVTNNGNDYSMPVTVLVVDGLCQDCDVSSLTCSIKASSCYIGGQCYRSGHRFSAKLHCDPSVDQRSWTPGGSSGAPGAASASLAKTCCILIASLAVLMAVRF